MENLKIIVLSIFLIISYFIYNDWSKEFNHHNTIVNNESAKIKSNKKDKNIPNISQSFNENSITKFDKDLITVNTNNIEVKINKLGGDIVEFKLLKFKNNNKKHDLVLLNYNNNPYTAISGLINVDGPDNNKNRAKYITDKNFYKLKNNSLIVNLHWKSKDNVEIIKSFEFHKDSYEIKVTYNVANNSSNAKNYLAFGTLKRKVTEQNNHFMGISTFNGIAYRNNEGKFKKLYYSKLDKYNYNWKSKGGWLSIVQQYFISTWVPNPQWLCDYKTENYGNNTYGVTFISPKLTVSPHQTKNISMNFYAGPDETNRLNKVAPGLERTVDYGILWPIASIIFLVMKKINNIVGNWGLSIIIITVLIKLLFYRLSASSYKSMAKLKLLAPKIKYIQEKYKDDKQKMGQAMMELYRKEKANPLGGCLPIIIQIPFFFALYWVIIESVDLRHAPFFGWIHDLSSRDPYFILPITMGITMLIQQKMNPAPQDPTQEKMMLIMPIVFTALFLYFPAGLVLYWVVNNLLSILQQWWVTRKYV